jgi:hypothetical protein
METNKSQIWAKLDSPEFIEKIIKQYIKKRLIFEDVDDSISYIINEQLGTDEYFSNKDCEKILKKIIKWSES